MASAKITITLEPAEYSLLKTELDEMVKWLQEYRKDTDNPAAMRTKAAQRQAHLENLLSHI
jgi:hypothetical protein